MNPHPSVVIDVDHYHTRATDLHGMPNPIIGETSKFAVNLPRPFKTTRFSGPNFQIIAIRTSNAPLLNHIVPHPDSSQTSLIVKPILIPDTGVC